jgi:hypothetical protein
MKAETLARFWVKVDKNGPIPSHRPELGPCWLWTAARKPLGYGQFLGEGRRKYNAHILSYVLVRGPVPNGLELDHLCRVPGCVNPFHLEAVTHAENVRRGLSKALHRPVKACKWGHPYTEENTYLKPRGGFRECRTCRAERDHIRWVTR